MPTQCARLSNTVQITGRNFEDEIQQSQNLTFSFNKNVGPEHPTDVWEATPYIEFKPAVKGQFKWLSPSELLFSPAVAFDPATDYRAELTKAVLTRTDSKDLSVSGDEVEFHTPYLQLTGTETWWTRQTDTGQPIAKTRLRFNYAVSGAEVAPKLSLKTGEQPLAIGPLQGNADPLTGGGLVITLPNAPRPDNEQPLTLTVDKGLNVPYTAYTTKEAIEQTGTCQRPRGSR